MSAKTPFAGLEALGPGEPLSTDGYAFQSKNPYIIDLLLKIGAVLHRHDAHAAMADPALAPTVAANNTGGSIEAGTAIYVAYTLTDPQGGETLPTAPVQVVIGGGYQDPTGAPTLALDFSAGSMLASTPLYAVSVTDGLGGETALGPPASITVTPAANAQVQLSGLAAIVGQASGGDSSASWRLWRSMDGGASWDLMATGTADTWTDDGTAVGDCSVTPPSIGTTGNTGSFSVTVPAGQPAGAQFINIYACTDGAFTNPCLLATLPITDAGVEQDYAAIAVQAGMPPAVSTCIGGANQIDPDTDILQWPWKRPVATVADLPTTGNEDGDARIVLSNFSIYTWNGSAWNQIIGSGGAAPNVTDSTTTVDAPSQLQFAGAGGATVAVTNPSPGVALITVNAPSGGGGGTGGGLAIADTLANLPTTGVADGTLGLTTNTWALYAWTTANGFWSLLADYATTDHWRGPVTSAADLSTPDEDGGGSDSGTVRVTLDTNHLWLYDGNVWVDENASRMAGAATPGVNTSRTVDPSWAGGVVLAGATTPITLTIDTIGNQNWSPGTVIDIVQWDTAQVTIAAAAGVTILSPGNLVKTRVQRSTITLRMVGYDEWLLSGDLG